MQSRALRYLCGHAGCHQHDLIAETSRSQGFLGLYRAQLEQHVSAGDQAAFEGCFRMACGQAIFEAWGKDDTATQAALALLDFGNELLTAAGPSKLPGATQNSLDAQPVSQQQVPSRQPTAFWQGSAGPDFAKYLTLPPLSDVERSRPAARAKPPPKAEQPAREAIKRKLSSEGGQAKKPRTAGKKTLAKGLPRVMQRHFAVLLSCLEPDAAPEGPETWQVSPRHLCSSSMSSISGFMACSALMIGIQQPSMQPSMLQCNDAAIPLRQHPLLCALMIEVLSDIVHI